jgi:hypothetical protein
MGLTRNHDKRNWSERKEKHVHMTIWSFDHMAKWSFDIWQQSLEDRGLERTKAIVDCFCTLLPICKLVFRFGK